MGKTKSGLRIYLQPAFLICVGFLATAGAGMSVAMKGLGMTFKKEPLPLKKTLELLDEGDLAPYRVVLPKHKIENEDVLKALGTEDYIQWIMEDTERPADSPVKRCLLFITYYKVADRVPHVPEECMVGGGYQRLVRESVTFEVDNNEGFRARVPGKYLVFGLRGASLWQSSVRIPDLYFFKVNGQYAGSRNDARMALNKNLFGKYSYFCKVELVFRNQDSIAPDKEQAVKASEKLLSVVLPVLEREHWPDWQEVKRGTLKQIQDTKHAM
jgi:hypothetical protein